MKLQTKRWFWAIGVAVVLFGLLLLWIWTSVTLACPLVMSLTGRPACPPNGDKNVPIMTTLLGLTITVVAAVICGVRWPETLKYFFAGVCLVTAFGVGWTLYSLSAPARLSSPATLSAPGAPGAPGILRPPSPPTQLERRRSSSTVQRVNTDPAHAQLRG